MKFFKQQNLVIVWLGQDNIQACHFRRKSQKYKLVSSVRKEMKRDANPADVLKSACKEIGWSQDYCTIVSSSFSSGVFYQTTSVPMQ